MKYNLTQNELKAMKEIKLRLKKDFTSYLNPARFYGMHDYNTFILQGGRGVGKTTALVAIKGVENFKKHGEQFLVTRRHVNECQAVRKQFQKDLPEIKTTQLLKGLWLFTYMNVVIGYLCALSMQASVKSGIDFSRVTLIIYDECVIKVTANRRYIKGEPEEFFELISTITRTRNDYKIFLLSNNLDRFNPWFEYFKIPTKEFEQYKDKDRGLFVERVRKKGNLEQKEERTPLFKLVKGTPYAEYHYNNKVLMEDTTCNICVKDVRDTLINRIVYNSVTINVYLHRGKHLFFERINKRIVDSLAFNISENNKFNYLYVRLFRDSSVYKFMNYEFYNQKCFYDNIDTFDIISNLMLEINGEK